MTLSQARPWVALLRFHEYGPLFLLCGLAGSLYAGIGAPAGLLALLCFIALFSSSAFVLNDVADRREDAEVPESRNPIAKGEIGEAAGVALFALLAAGSLAALRFVSPPALYAAPLVYGLYWGYSWGPAFKARPGVDVAVHGAVPALFVFMGSALYAPPVLGTALLSGVVFCMAAMSGVLQGVRDMGKDAAHRKTTALALGEGRSVDLSLALVGAGVALYAAAVAAGALPLTMAALLPGAWLLLAPLLRLRGKATGAVEAIRSVRLRGVALAMAAMALYAVSVRPG
jgi:4-hydroxybenzoate polyprenyltransferase